MSSTANTMIVSPPQKLSKRQLVSLLSWTLYDWAVSPFAAVIQTFVFAAYFVRSIAANETLGATQWGVITGISALVVGIISPILGAISDHSGGRRIWLAVFTILCIIPTALMWFLLPSHEYIWQALWLVGIGAIGAEGAYIFYNSMLPELSPPSQIGRWSGWGWGMGYAGGMAALIVALLAFIDDGYAWFSLNQATAEPVRASFLMVAVWYAVFALPLFLFAPRSPPSTKPMRIAALDGIAQLWMFFKEIRKYSNIVRFLIAKLFYIDGLATLFAFGGIYASTLFGMTEMEVLEFGISMNIVAGLGSATLSFLDDLMGSKRVIMASLVAMIIAGILALISVEMWQFWAAALTLSVFVGPIQSSSRAMMGRIAPAHMRRQMFGFYMLSGKATAFFGPLLYGAVTLMTNSIRLGMSTSIFLFILGGIIMMSVPRDHPGEDYVL